MKKFEPADIHCLNAAEGWLELGNHLEADRELNALSADLHCHPIVLQMRWRIFSQAKEWPRCVEIAMTLTDLNPDDEQSMVNLGNSLYFSGRTQEAFERVTTATQRFPRNAILRYNLACYAAQLGRLQEARDWLDRAFKIAADPASMKLMALDDPDLEPLWNILAAE